MELHQLEQFKTIAECRTMREAADKLYLSQPALSQNLKKLEAELGCTLFDRSHNHLELTAYGEILLTHAHRILFDLNEVYEKIEQRKQEESKVIRIGSFYLPLNIFTFPQIADGMPQCSFQIIMGKAVDIAKDLIAGRLDLAFLPDQFCPAHFAREPFLEEQLQLSVPADSPLSKTECITNEDLTSIPLLIPKDLPGLSQWYEEVVAAAHVPSHLIEHLPMKDYLETMDKTERAHFTTSMMAMFSGAGNVRPSIPVENSLSPRLISVAYDGANERAQAVVDYIKDKRSELVSNHAFFPFLIYQNASSNLSMKFAL